VAGDGEQSGSGLDDRSGGERVRKGKKVEDFPPTGHRCRDKPSPHGSVSGPCGSAATGLGATTARRARSPG
jgi:hypothetical protein